MPGTQKLKSLDRVRRDYRGFRVEMWIVRGASGRNERDTYSYKIVTPTGVLFEGTNYRPAFSAYGNGERVLDGLLKWICIQSGDTDADYFKLYNQEQWEWSKSEECDQVREELEEIKNTV